MRTAETEQGHHGREAQTSDSTASYPTGRCCGSTPKRSPTDLRVTQEGMRHRSPVTTAGYAWVGASDVAAAVGRISA
ncbi:MAG: hypothetical protein IPG97_16700 [Microthrixaceae bacterium]|nr:hypothetical protein [Microthrixaceae bacterium]